MDLSMKFDEELFHTNIKVENSNKLLKDMGKKLVKQGYAKEEYIDSIIERELKYPTGLPAGKISLAIPHTDNELVNTTAISVATLEKPVLFKSMAEPDEDVEVSIVFMLAISEPKGQLEMLQKVMDMIQDTEFKEAILKIQSNSELLEVIKNRLGGE